MLFEQPVQTEAYQTGGVYQKQGERAIVATAKVLTIEDTAGGIPHVRFDLRYRMPSGEFVRQGVRTLALDAFASEFHDTPAACARHHP